MGPRGRVGPELDCLLTTRGVRGAKASAAGSAGEKAGSWGPKSLGVGQSGLEDQHGMSYRGLIPDPTASVGACVPRG